MGKRGPYAIGRVRRQQILQRALEVLAADGYDAASVTRTAQAADLSTTGPLHSFGSKEKLLTEILRKRDEVDDPQLDERRASLTELEAAYMRVVSRNAHIRCFQLRSEEHTSELQSRGHLVCRLLLEKKINKTTNT